MVMAPGMMFTIEPMVNMGKVNIVTDESNGWEVGPFTPRMESPQPSGRFRCSLLMTDMRLSAGS